MCVCENGLVCDSLSGLYGVCLEVQSDPDVSALLRRMNGAGGPP